MSISIHDNVNSIGVKCTQDGKWEVNGGLEGLTCEDSISTNSSLFLYQTLNIPDCEDRTVYCSFPPQSINSGDITLISNPSPFFQNIFPRISKFVSCSRKLGFAIPLIPDISALP